MISKSLFLAPVSALFNSSWNIHLLLWPAAVLDWRTKLFFLTAPHQNLHLVPGENEFWASSRKKWWHHSKRNPQKNMKGNNIFKGARRKNRFLHFCGMATEPTAWRPLEICRFSHNMGKENYPYRVKFTTTTRVLLIFDLKKMQPSWIFTSR